MKESASLHQLPRIMRGMKMVYLLICYSKSGHTGRFAFYLVGGRHPCAVAFGAALSVGAVQAGFRRARGISDGSENRPLIQSSSQVGSLPISFLICSIVSVLYFKYCAHPSNGVSRATNIKSFILHIILYFLLFKSKDYRQITSMTCHTSTPDTATKRYAGGITCPCCALPPVI